MIVVQLTVLLMLLPLALAAPVGTPLSMVPEEGVLPDTRFGPFNPRYKTFRPSLATPVTAPVSNQAPWWRQWNWPTFRKEAQPVSNQAPWWRQRSWPTFRKEAQPILSGNRLRWVLLSGPSKAVAGRIPNVAIRSVGDRRFGVVRLPGNSWDGQVIGAMKRRGQPFFVVGKNNKVWFVNSNGSVKSILNTEQDAILSSLRSAEVKNSRTEFVHLPGVTAKKAAAAARTSSGASWWSRVVGATKGRFGGFTPDFMRAVGHIQRPI